MKKITITEKMRESANFVYYNHHARINAVSSICFEVFLQIYGRYPELVEIWDFDKDIIEQAEAIEEKLCNEYYNQIK